MNSMASKKSKKSPKPPTRNLLLGIATNIALGPLGFRIELDANPQDERNARPPRIILNQRESEMQEPTTGEISTSAVESDDAGPNNYLTRDNTNQEETELGVASESTKQHRENMAIRTPVILNDAANEGKVGFCSLKCLLETISVVYAGHEESLVFKNKVELLLSHITMLDTLFTTRPGDVPEMRRRDELICTLRSAEGQLRPLLSDGEQQLADCIQDDKGVLTLLEDVQDAVFRYQTMWRTRVGDQGPKQIDPAEAAVINNSRHAQQAEYRHGNRTGCLKGTRSAILDEIELWTRDFGKPPVYWLNGLAGTGKTTIAQTVAERMFANGQLGASFFCSRDFEDRSNLQFIFPTIAIQLSRTYAEFRSIFVPLVQSDPDVVQESLYGQMNKLIVDPLVKSGISTVIVIDALDECKDEEPASAILSVLGQFVAEMPKAKFLVTGRPEPRIREGFRLPLLAEVTDVFVLHQVQPNRVNNDIRVFFKHNFSELKRRRQGLNGWPTEGQLEMLCERAAGLFVYAMATVKFIDQHDKNPKKQLNRILQSLEGGFEGRIKFKANTTLDSLYMTILQEAFRDDNLEDDAKVRSVLGAVIFATNPLTPSTISTLLGFDDEDVFPVLSSIHSLLILQDDVNRPVQPFHKSFPDFIVDPTRCVDSRFRLNPPDQHAEILVGCLGLMNRRLEHNMCKLPDGVTNSEVDDLKERVDQHVNQALQYACRSWHKHLVNLTPTHTQEIIPVLHQFLEKKFVFWLEVLSALGAAREAVDSMEAAAKWLDASPTFNLVEDYFRFVVTFFDVISTSAPHIYHSALPLSPQTSIVRDLYKQYAHPLARIVRGLPISWDPVVATLYRDDTATAATWSPCNRFIAVAWSKSSTIDILDALTLKRLNTFNHPKPYAKRCRCISYSPDGRLLMQPTDGELTGWDLQTGGSLGIIPSHESEFHPPLPSSGQHNQPEPTVDYYSTWSKDGKFFAVAHGPDGLWPAPWMRTITTYNLLSMERLDFYHLPQGCINSPIWIDDERLRFAAVKPEFIVIWEVGFSSTHTPTEVEFLPAPGEITEAQAYHFLPTLSRLAFVLWGFVQIWDARNSQSLLKFVDRGRPMYMSFSSNGHFFACANEVQQVRVWKESSTGYTLHQTLEFTSHAYAKPFFSPNGESIIALNRSTIHRWPIKDPTPSLPSNLPRLTNRRAFILGFSPNGILVAVAQEWAETVTVFNLQSGDPQLVIDTGMDVCGLGITGTTIAVVDREKVVTWSIAAGDCALDARAKIGDRVQTQMLDPSQLLIVPVAISPDLNYLAIRDLRSVHIYDMTTGKRLASTDWGIPWFTPDGLGVWSLQFSEVKSRFAIVRDGEYGAIELKDLGLSADSSGGPPWQSSRGYKVVHDEWVLSPTRKRLLWLPRQWRSHELHMIWSGRFLGLLHDGLPEVVILEFFE